MYLLNSNLFTFLKITVFVFIALFSAQSFAQLDNEHYLPPLKQVSNNQGIVQQSVYFSTPETTPFSIVYYTDIG